MCAHFALQLESEVVNTQQNRQELEQHCQDLQKVGLLSLSLLGAVICNLYLSLVTGEARIKRTTGKIREEVAGNSGRKPWREDSTA